MSIAENCMLIGLHVSTWSGQKLDRATTAKVIKDAKAQQDAGRFNKHLLPKESRVAIDQAVNALKYHWRQETLPWKENGERILVRTKYMDYMARFGDLKAQFDDAVDQFIRFHYPVIRERAAFRMGGLVDEEDYPRPYELRNKYQVRVEVEPVTEGVKDFRVKLSKEERKLIQLQAEENFTNRLHKAMEDVWKRVQEGVEAHAERLKNPEYEIRQPSVDGLRALIKGIPDLNLTKDPKLDRICEEIENSLLGYDAKDLREADLKTRKVLSGEAQAIVDKMRGYMRAFEVAA